MLIGYVHHILDSLLPPRVTRGSNQISIKEFNDGSVFMVGGQDFLRLEFLSACKIMQDVDTALQILPLIPDRFFPALFKAIIQKSFYDERHILDSDNLLAYHLAALGTKKKCLLATSSVRALVLEWPYKTLVLRDLMPPLPAPTKKPNRMNLQGSQARLNKYFIGVLQLIPHTFITSPSRNFSEIKTSLCKLDVSGFYSQKTSFIDLQVLKKYVTLAYKSKSQHDHVQSELVMDVKLHGEELKEFNSFRDICKQSSQESAGLVIRFRRVHMISLPNDCVIPVIMLLADNGTECLELEMCGLDDRVVKSVSRLSETLSCLSLAYNSYLSSFEFLADLPHLSQLNLSGINLRGKCGSLGGLARGLEYLRMVGCSLKSEDLKALSTTKHVLSLHHLDLSENYLGNPIDFISLCNLCQTLQMATVLELENCNLERCTPDMLADLVNILMNMPSLTLLRLNRNDFHSSLAFSHLIFLADSSSLRCLCLTTPSDRYLLGDDYDTIAKGIDEFHDNFFDCLAARNATHLYVDWNEESTYNHWFYSI